MTSHSKCVDGVYYPEFHPGWGGCAEELFHYTSRYIACTEAFLRNLADQRQFNLSGYRANLLNDAQRRLLAAILAAPHDQIASRAIPQLVRSVISGEKQISETLLDQFRDQLKIIPEGVPLVYADRPQRTTPPDVAPLDPFLNLADRLSLAVAVRDHHVEVQLKLLAQHLDSPNLSLRNALQEAILKLHFAGYLLKNHPGLTHKTARELDDQDSEPPSLSSKH
ncbi:MAG: endonuclease [Candidatus Thiodiazotropha sp.]